MFRSLIHISCKIRAYLHSSACGYPSFPVPFVEETILSPFCSLGPFDKDYLTMYVGVYLGVSLFCPIDLCLFLCQYQTILITVAL